MNKNELRNTILSQIQLPCIGKNWMQVEPVSGQMQTRQLQQAIDDLSRQGGGTLVLQPGVYRTGALHLKNGVELHLASEDTLVQFVPDDPAENYPLVFSHWEASPCYNFSALLYACDAQDIAVTGKGVLDGGADADHWWNWHHQVETSWSENKPDLQLADRSALRTGMDTAQRKLKQAAQTVAAAEATVEALTAQQTAAQKELPARSAEELTAQQTELTAARETLRSREKQLSAQLLPNRKTAAQYRAAAEARQTLESRWQWVSALAATAGGTLTSKQKIRLEAYIQMNYLDRILRYANTRLMQMTAGQYELERIGAENQRSQSGLDLGVIDHYNGTRRSVKTLSGGESFKASLALALGLSDEVQSSAGGIRLDTLFLDEGFGSLDEESLKLAIRVLSGLTEGDRLVGIISHVGALKDRIDRQVVVHKARTGGSTVELRV